MKSNLLFLLAAALAAASTAHAQALPPQGGPGGPVYARESINFGYADVLRVDPVYETVRYREPREECYDQEVQVHQRGGGDPTGGTVVGAIVGGLIGNQVGSGSGRRAATAAGALIGGSVGHNVDSNNGGPDSNYRGTERRCEMVEVEREDRRIAGYDVEYRFKGDVYVSRLDHDPGNKLRVRVSVSPAD